MLNLNWNIIWTFVNIIVLFALLKIFLFKPVSQMIEKRQRVIKNSLDRAAAAKKEASALRAAYSQKLQEADRDADSIIENAKSEARVQREIIIDKASQDADEIVKDAEKQIEVEKQRTIEDAPLEIADVALMAAKRAMEEGDISVGAMESFVSQVGDSDE